MATGYLIIDHDRVLGFNGLNYFPGQLIPLEDPIAIAILAGQGAIDPTPVDLPDNPAEEAIDSPVLPWLHYLIIAPDRVLASEGINYSPGQLIPLRDPVAVQILADQGAIDPTPVDPNAPPMEGESIVDAPPSLLTDPIAPALEIPDITNITAANAIEAIEAIGAINSTEAATALTLLLDEESSNKNRVTVIAAIKSALGID